MSRSSRVQGPPKSSRKRFIGQVEDAAVAFEPGKPVPGAAALRAGFEAFAAVTPVFHYDRGHDVMIGGDVAVHAVDNPYGDHPLTATH